VIGTGLTGVFLSLKAELPAMMESGGGAIVNLSSANGIVGVAGLAAYAAAKHGVVGLTRSVALECADGGIRVNCIGPGYVATPRILQAPQEVLDEMSSSHPMARLAKREEVAELTAFLLSERASFCTGGFYPIDGGYTARRRWGRSPRTADPRFVVEPQRRHGARLRRSRPTGRTPKRGAARARLGRYRPFRRAMWAR
jgi:NAD(P)-dependent dehydrogenase (short-subunit alcohol dehydrogenase family)